MRATRWSRAGRARASESGRDDARRRARAGRPSVRAPRARAHRRAPGAARALRPGPEGGLHEHPLAARRAGGRPAEPSSTPARRRSRPRSRSTTRAAGRRSTGSRRTPATSGRGSSARTDGSGSRWCAIRRAACGRHGRPSCCCASRASSEAFGDAAWFPRLPERAGDLVEDFRRFVAAVGAGEAQDVHWAVQRDLVEQLPLDHVGRVERMAETLAALRAHVGGSRAGRRTSGARTGACSRSRPAPTTPGRGGPRPPLRRRPRGLRLRRSRPPGRPRTGSARPPSSSPPCAPRSTRTSASASCTVSRRAGSSGRARSRSGSRRPPPARSATPAPRCSATSRRRTRSRSGGPGRTARPARGFTAVLRVKDEARSLPWALPPLLRAAARVVLVDNGSTDGSAAVARRIAAVHGAAGPPGGPRLPVHGRPLRGRAPGHPGGVGAQPGVLLQLVVRARAHRLRAQVGRGHGADRPRRGDAARSGLAARVRRGGRADPAPRLYVLDERRAFLDTGLRNCEPWAWPNRPGYSFVKATDWELPLWGGEHRDVTLPEWSCVELKFLDADEFAHWSQTDFGASARTRRKRREWAVSGALAAGAPPPAGVVAIHAPAGRHVIDHVRETWLPARARGAPPA